MNSDPEARIDAVRNYLKIPKEHRPELKTFLKQHKLNQSTFYKLHGKVDLINKMMVDTQPEIRAIVERLGEDVRPELSEEALTELEEKRVQEMDEAMFEAGKGKKSSKYAELWYKRKGVLVEKQEVDVKIGLSADEIARRNLEAERQLRKWGKS